MMGRVQVTLSIVVLLGFIGCTPSPYYHRDGKSPSKQKSRKSSKQASESASKTVAGKASKGSLRKGQVITGLVSYYGPGFHGKKTASGETFDQNKLTCAHKSMPFNTRLKVTLLDTKKSVIVRVNDRGPYVGTRILDLSVEAARRIGLLEKGVGRVSIVVLEVGGS